jgi:hypothetical protein
MAGMLELPNWEFKNYNSYAKGPKGKSRQQRRKDGQCKTDDGNFKKKTLKVEIKNINRKDKYL